MRLRNQDMRIVFEKVYPAQIGDSARLGALMN